MAYFRLFKYLSLVPLSFGALMGLSNPNLSSEHFLAQKEMSLENRYDDKFVNDVFKKNILLNLAYMQEKIPSAKDIKWEEINQPFNYQFKLEPNATFAFHDSVAEKYKASVTKTTNAHFNSAEGFKTDGYLFGDGVCHLASLIFWVAKEANLEAEAPTNHDFTLIPDIPKQYGVSIYSNPYSKESNTAQNLYIRNNKSKPISFKFGYDGQKVKVAVSEVN